MAASEETLRLLAKYIGGMAQQSAQTDIARDILLRSQIDWNSPNWKPKGSGSGGPSVVSRIFDILSRPNYTVANVVKPFLYDIAGKGDAEIGDIPANAWKGLSGKEKTTFTRMFTDPKLTSGTLMGAMPKNTLIALGLTADIAGDPTTYIGPGAVKGVVKAGRTVLGISDKTSDILKAAKSMTAVPSPGPAIQNTLDTTSAVSRILKATPEGKAATPLSKTTPKSVTWTPEAIAGAQSLTKRLAKKAAVYTPKTAQSGRKYGADFSNAMKGYQHTARMTRDPGFYGQVQRSEQLLNRIAQADPQATSRVKPKPPVEKIGVTRSEKSMAVIIGRQAARKLPTGTKKMFNPKQQLMIFKSLLRKTDGAPLVRMERATAMLRATETYLKGQGFGFKFWDGTSVRLTDIFDEIGDVAKLSPDILSELEKGRISNPMLDQAVEAARTRNAMEDSKHVVLGLDNVTEETARAKAATSPSRAEKIIDGLGKDLQMGLKTARISPAAQNTANALFKKTLNSQIPQVQRAMSMQTTVAHQIMNQRATAKQSISYQTQINRAIEKHMNSPYRVVATKLGNHNKAVEFLGERFATHYSNSIVRPISQDFNLSALANAQMRSRALSDIAKNTTPQVRYNAFKTAQRLGNPSIPPPSDLATDQLALRFRTEIEKLFSSTGIKDTAQSVSTRAAFTMQDINKELRRTGSKFQFTSGKVEDALGEIHDFSKGVDWLKSWEVYQLGTREEPLELLSKMQLATERVSRRYALLDEVAARFGNPIRNGPFQHLVEDPRLAGRYFTKDIAIQINRMNQMLKGAYTPQNDFIKFVDKVTSAWKSGVTIYAPSHHIRNFIGDTWLSWIAGVNNPKRYAQAGKILKSQKGRYAGALVEDLVSPQAMERALTRPGRIVTKTRRGYPLTDEQIYIAAHQRGLLLNAKAMEDIYGEALMPKIFGGKVQHAASAAAEVREHTVRLAHFIDAVSKSKASSLKEAFDEAAHTVRKWHPDGMDLTDFERKYMRRIFPFYSWTRKAFPLVLESMVIAPGKIVAYPKIMDALQLSMGIESPSRTDPFPVDGMIPEWLKEKGIGPIGHSAMGGPAGIIGNLARQGVDKQGQAVGGYAVVNPSNPMVDMLAQFGGMGNPRAPLQGAGSMLNPLAKIPIEVTSGRQLFTDVPISYDPNRYVTEQIPGGAIASRLTNMGVFGPTVRGKREGLGNQEALINYLTAAGLVGTGPYKSQVGYQERDKERERNKKRIEQLLRQSAGG